MNTTTSPVQGAPHSDRKRALWLATFLAAATTLSAVPISLLPDVSLLIPFATFGGSYNDAAVTVHGDVGVADGGSLTVMGASFIDGDVYRGTGSSLSAAGGTIGGTIYTNQNLAAAQAQVFSASVALAGLAPNLTLGSVTTGQSFGSTNGTADVQVFNLTSLALGSSNNISFIGDAGDYFVLNIAADLDLGGNAVIGSLAQAPYTFVNVYESGGSLPSPITQVGNTIYGSLLIPYENATLHSVSGAIWSGSNTIKLQSDAVVQGAPILPPPVSVPEGGTTVALMGTAMIALGLIGRARRREKLNSAS